MNPYIQSLRLRTLPLSVAGIVLGTGLTVPDWRLEIGDWRFWSVFALAVLTALCLQILSNLSNELGDALKGTDADQQGRAAYGLQSGTITIPQMKRMIGLFIGLSLMSGTALLCVALPLFSLPFWIFIGLGLLAVIGAMTYTLGKHSYGYIGLGDLGVFLFFGLLSTCGAYFLQTLGMTWEIVWCGVAIGLPCVGVLNLNNIRDMTNDRKHGKRTFASLLGEKGGRIYHSFLLAACLCLFVLYGHLWTLVVCPVWAWHLWFVWSHDDRLDRQMPVLMFSTLAVSILACL